MHGLKLRKTDILRILEDSLQTLSVPQSVEVVLKSEIRDKDVWLDHERIVKALADLEQNAVEAMPRGGTLTVSGEESADRIMITIRDTGTGIPEEYMDELFTPFFSTKPVGEGTGLGLPSAYGTVKAHRGAMSIESNARPEDGPTGTTVKISLPRRLIQPPSGKHTIILDDE
ncbi:MAG TPA: ATP-binding protein [Syntrophales bacterium]|nr:ATP-binding protein [Syntrophales bacterium]